MHQKPIHKECTPLVKHTTRIHHQINTYRNHTQNAAYNRDKPQNPFIQNACTQRLPHTAKTHLKTYTCKNLYPAHCIQRIHTTNCLLKEHTHQITTTDYQDKPQNSYIRTHPPNNSHHPQQTCHTIRTQLLLTTYKDRRYKLTAVMRQTMTPTTHRTKLFKKHIKHCETGNKLSGLMITITAQSLKNSVDKTVNAKTAAQTKLQYF